MKRTLVFMASCLMAGAVAWNVPAYADPATDGSNPDPAYQAQGQYPDMNRGADPSNPANYAFLPPGQSKPVPGQRSHSPQSLGTDLASGLPYTISAQFPDSYWQQEATGAFPDRGQLTNGKFESLDFTDPQWVGLQYQYVNSITINLGQVENIHGVSLDFLQDLGAGIVFPDGVQYYVSQDGTNWAPVGSVESTAGQGDYTPQSQPFELTGVNVNAQYVRAQFTNKIWGFIDQFSVYGYPTLNPAAKTPVGAPLLNQPSGYLSRSDSATGGANNMLLAYTDGYGSLGTWTASDFAPMVAHEDAAGNPAGWMFDSVLFTPYSVATSSTAWSSWVNDLFTPGTQLSALNDAVGKAKAQLNAPNYTEKVVVTIPVIGNVSNFGAVNNGQDSLDLNPADVGQHVAYNNKVQAVNWYINQVEAKWQSAGLSNLTLAGFYWQPESLQITQPYDKPLVESTADIIHRDGLKFYWIPFYGAVGITDWKQLGFDDVMVQPNVSFHWSMPAQPRFQSVTDFARYYGTGLEMEAHWDVIDNWSGAQSQALATTAQNRYFNYFTAGNVFGYEKSVPMSYYENSKTLVSAYQNPDPFYHRVYDNTATFIDGQWTATTFQ